jgi:hypothetical protein
MRVRHFFFTTIVVFLGILFAACKPAKVNENGFTEYIIKKGDHYSNHLITKTINTDEFNFIAKFDSSAIYKNVDSVNQADINKLYGFTEDNLTNDHYNSARIGWRWYHEELQLMGYCYNEGQVSYGLIKGNIELGKEVFCSIKKDDGKYIFSVDGSIFTLPRKSTSSKFAGFKLYPYFGGDETAPHEIKILIKDI